MIPDFQTIMLPILEVLSDGKEWEKKAVVEKVGDKFNLTEDERNEFLPSGNQLIISNRVGWAKLHLSKADLLHSPTRGCLKSQRMAYLFWEKTDKN